MISYCLTDIWALFRLAVSYNLGWRVGWAIAPAFIASAIRNIHSRITDTAPAPFQEAALIALRSPPEYFESLRRVGYSFESQELSFLLFGEIDSINSIQLNWNLKYHLLFSLLNSWIMFFGMQDYESKRDFIAKLLVDIGFEVQFEPQGSFFLFVELPKSCTLTDVHVSTYSAENKVWLPIVFKWNDLSFDWLLIGWLCWGTDKTSRSGGGAGMWILSNGFIEREGREQRL